MKKKEYTVPQVTVCLVEGGVVMNAISTLSETNQGAEGLGISEEAYEDEARVREYGFEYPGWEEEGFNYSYADEYYEY